MTSSLVVGGLSNTGKTSLICSLLIAASKNGGSFAGFKPFDKGLLKLNASDLPRDGERFCQYMKGEPMETLVSPYCANEDYPFEMAYRRDGIRINWNILQQRLTILQELYDKILIEIPSSLLTPLTEKMMVMDWLKEFNPHILWMVHPQQDQFLRNLHEIRLMKESGLEMTILFNNATQITDQDLVFYIWEKIEAFTGQQAAGMMPFIPSFENDFAKMAEKLQTSVPEFVRSILELNK